MKEHKRNNWLWVILATFCVVIVGLSVGIVVKLTHEDVKNKVYAAIMQEMKTTYSIDALVSEIVYKFKNNVDYTAYDAEADFVRLIDSLDDREKVYVIIPYADFVFEQTGDIQKAVRMMENAADEVDNDLKFLYYISIARLYEGAEMYDQSAKYYNMASGLHAERDDLWDGE